MSTAAPERARPIDSRQGREAGRMLRADVPRRALATLTTGDRDPLGILAAQNRTRVANLLPLRAERMAASAFAFYRGTAAIMAADLARDPHTGILVGSCGDAHVANFGFYASQQRELVFDLNDFDEAAWAPWEWDLKRLVTSIVIAGQASSRAQTVVDDAAVTAVRAYARALAARAKLTALQRYYAHSDPTAATGSLDAASRSALGLAVRDAQRRTGERAARKLTERGADGRVRLIERPPTMTHVDVALHERLQQFFDDYVASAQVDVRMLLNQFEVVDLCHRVVGVGSVGTRSYLLALQDGDGNVLLLQAKEAAASVLAEHGGITQPTLSQAYVDANGHGARVVGMQRILQAVSDPLLGHLRTPAGDFYVRKFHDMKGGIDMETLEDAPFRRYAEACAATLARAHSQSATATKVSAYIGGGRAIADAMLEWAYAYAAMSRADYDAFVAARA